MSTMTDYNPIKIQEKWQKKWEKEETFKVDIKKAKKPYYNLMMFPYPSGGGLHVGNVYAFVGSDIHGRYMRMRGHDVFEPIGFDSFGIHSENFAIQKGEHPRDLTNKNIEHFRENQLKRMGNIFDWEHEVITSEPNYYKWTQWLFLQLYKAGLAYRAKAPVEWCPSCKTVLADEQVVSGKCERCSADVVQKELEQWFLKITKYAEKLLDNLEKIDWSPVIKTIQRNWIGKSEGAEIEFRIKNLESSIRVFTTRPDTLFGATYMVLAPEHELVEQLENEVKNWDEIQEYIKASKKKTEIERTDLGREKTGVELKGIRAINPANKEEIPIWIADYVLAGYGAGAVMAVPAHDQRDFEFAMRHNLPIREVVAPQKDAGLNAEERRSAYEGEGIIINSGNFNDMKSDEAKDKITEFVSGEKKVNYHLRDWLISRQRYWGPPIPVIYCRKCQEIRNPKSEIRNKRKGIDYTIIDSQEYAIIPVPEKDLPVELPYVEEFRPTGTDKSPLATVEEFVKTKCPECGKEARRETDVSDTFLDSSWYFLRYPSIGFQNLKPTPSSDGVPGRMTGQIPWNTEITRRWLPVDMYIGGKEHAVLHLMYARFITMALYDMGYIAFDEPFKKFRAHGLLIREGAKISKSKGNTISPDEYFDSYGVDVFRMYLVFLGPYEQGGDWQDKGIVGVSRFLKRVWRLVNDYASLKKPPNFQFPISNFQSNSNDQNSKNKNELERITHKTIKKVTEDIESLQYNTAIAALMEFLNSLQSTDYRRQHIEILLKLLAPFAPHLAEELWETLGHKSSIHSESWPEYDEKYLKEDRVNIVIQINGKVRGQIEVKKGSDEERVKELALQEDKVARWIERENIKKTIFIKDRVINFVV